MIAALALVLVVGCSVGPVYEKPPTAGAIVGAEIGARIGIKGGQGKKN